MLYRFSSFTSTILDYFSWGWPSGVDWDGSNTLVCVDGVPPCLCQLSSFTTTCLHSFNTEDFDVNATDPGGIGWQPPILLSLTTYLYTGSTPTGAEISTLYLNTDDSNNNIYSVRKPTPPSSYNYSYWKHIALYLVSWGNYSQISNIKFYCDGSIGWSGCRLLCAQVTNYDQATGTVGETGDEASANHTDSPSMTDIQNYTSSSPLSLSGSLTSPNTGKVLDGYLLLQLEVSSSAAVGALPEETLTWVCDVV